MTAVLLTPAHQRHLARLAKATQCEPQDIQETSKGLAEIAAGKGVAHALVMADARATIARHGRHKIAA